MRTWVKNIVRIHKTNWIVVVVFFLLFLILFYHCFYSIPFNLPSPSLSFLLLLFFHIALQRISSSRGRADYSFDKPNVFLFVTIFDTQKKDDLRGTKQKTMLIRLEIWLFVAIWKDILALDTSDLFILNFQIHNVYNSQKKNIMIRCD